MTAGTENVIGTPRPEAEWPPLSPLRTGIRCRCPRCGEGRLFNGFLTLKPACEVCGLDYSFADPADGPAFFVICFGCIPSVVLGLWIETAFSAPYWVHLFTTLPFTLATCIPPLRPLKGWLIASQYYYKAEEGRIIEPPRSEPLP
ncbi:MAG TPA: DUF983 domain-containing protein [Kaistia sp.]|nr:DUF983 domain-containing protein [Kaistia sp.]